MEPPFRFLEDFSIIVRRDVWNYGNWNWNRNLFSSEMKDALLNIIHSYALKTLSLTDIIEVPITFFLHIVHLSTLELLSLSPNHFGDENSELSLLTWAASKGVAPVIDQCVWHFRPGRNMCASARVRYSYSSLISGH